MNHPCARPAYRATELDALAAGAWARFRAGGGVEPRNLLLMIYQPLADRAAGSEARVAGDIAARGVEYDQDDLRQIAMVALLELIEDFDHTTTPSFTKYASSLLRLRIKGLIRDVALVKRVQYRKGVRDNRMSGDSSAAFDLMESPYDGPEICAELAEFRESTMEWLETETDRRVFSLKFLEGWPSKRIAEHLGKHESTICFRLKEHVIPAIARAFPDAAPGLRKRLKRAYSREGS